MLESRGEMGDLGNGRHCREKDWRKRGLKEAKFIEL